MSRLDTDRQWEQWGAQRPYLGVLVSRDYREVTRGDAAWVQFMETGRRHVDDLFARLHRLGAPRQCERALDFGCGVGRLLVPFADRFDEVVGVDVSSSMLVEARDNLASVGVSNVALHRTDDSLSAVTGTFDLVHSFNVMQHIHPRRGLAITRRLLHLVRPGGAVVLHYCDAAPALHHRVKRVVGRSPLFVRLANRVRGSAPDTPIMQMLPYPFESVAALLRERGVDEVMIQWSTFHRNTFFQVHAAIPER